MPVQVSYPGVYVQEVPSGVRTITGVSTSVAMFIGMASKGPLGQPRRVLSFADHERAFGTDVAAGEMPDQVRQFFLNGGRTAWVMRIADGARAATAHLRTERGAAGADVLRLAARSAGAIGGTIRVLVDYDTASPESTFNMTVTREEADASGVPRVAELETFRDLTMRPGAGNNVVDTLNLRSGLVVVVTDPLVAPVPPPPIQGLSIAGVLMTAGTVNELNNIIDAANLPLPPAPGHKGRFQISVDGSPFVTVEVPKPTAPGDVPATIGAAVNLALAPTGKSVTVSAPSAAGFNVLQFESDSADGSVRIIPASSKDIAVGMQMGAAQGGLEIDGYAVQRPAPSGLFSTLGPLGPLSGMAALTSFIGTSPAAVTGLQVTDVTGVTSASPLAWPAGGGAGMAEGSLTGDQANSLRNVQENLDYLVGQINASATIPWTARRQGLRVVLLPDFGGADADVSATAATSPTDLGAPGGIFEPAANAKRYRLGSGLPGVYQTDVFGGLDGDFPKLSHYSDAFELIDREVDIFNLMVLPRAAGQADSDRTGIWSPASAFCETRRAFLLVDPKSDWTGVDGVTNGTNGVGSLRQGGLVKDHSAVFWPRLRINSPEGGERTVDPSGSIAGLAARIDSNRGVWKAPAGIEADLRGVRGVERAMSDAENGLINPEAVNAIRVFPNGIVSWGARTMDGFDNSGNDDYKYVPVRRLALFMEESLYRGLKFAVFEPNDEPLWAQIRLAAGAFMNNLFRQGAFQGQKASDAYFVKVDSETTTQNDINLGIVNVVVGFAPLKPAEFVIITIKQKAGQVQV